VIRRCRLPRPSRVFLRAAGGSRNLEQVGGEVAPLAGDVAHGAGDDDAPGVAGGRLDADLDDVLLGQRTRA
jgi:hypothetical protein